MQDHRKRPVLITVSGLSASGKSTTARALAALLPNAVYIDSDETRKELFGIPVTERLPPEAYTEEATRKLIEETARRIREHLAAGRTVVQSVMLVSDVARQRQEYIADDAGADFQGIWLKTDFKTLFDRVTARKGDASDADLAYVEQQQAWDIGAVTWPVIDAGLPREEVLKQALNILQPFVAAAATSDKRPPAP